MKLRRLILVLLCWVVVAVTMSGQSGSAQEALEAARKTAIVDGDLAAAIKQYQVIVARYEKNDRAAAAQALVRMAECYEKLGNAEAQRVYQRVIKEYADQPTAIAEARDRVAVPKPALASRLVWDRCCVQAVSRDGRYVVYLDGQDLATRDLSSGESRTLTKAASGTDGLPTYASDAYPSPDGREIAYTWFSQAQRYEVRVIAKQGGQPRVVMTGADRQEELYVKGWTPAGQIVVTRIQDVARDVVLIPSTGGVPHVVKYRSRVGANARVSPDGQFLGYSRPAAPDQRERDLFAMSLATGEDLPLLQHVADEYMLDWLPDGRLLFASDRGGAWGVWITRVAEGRETGEATMLQSFDSLPRPYGATINGDFYFGTPSQDLDIHLASLGAETGQRSGQLTRVTARTSGRKRSGAWSPDGARLAFVQPVASRGVPGVIRVDEMTIGVLTLANGVMKLTTLPLTFAHFPRWMPDGRSLVMLATERTGNQRLVRVDLETGNLTPIGERVRDFGIAPDGKRIFYMQRGNPPNIVVYDIALGTEETVLSGPLSGFALSPDGRWLVGIRPAGPKEWRVFTMSTQGGSVLELSAEMNRWNIPVQPEWSSDSRSVFVVRRTEAGDEVWRVPADGSAPKSTGITWSPGVIERVSTHPTDSHRLAISTSRPTNDMWVLSNLPRLPEK